MSGAQTSGFAEPNVLLNTLSGMTTSNVVHNQLLNTEAQQNIASADLEQVSRAANFVMTVPPEQRPMAYQAARTQLQNAGFAKNAPEQYPGDNVMAMMARQGTSSTDLLRLQMGQDAARGLATALTPQGDQPPAQGGQPPAQGGQPPVTSATPSGTIEPAALTNANAVRDGLIKRGMDVDTATAFAANALHESVANPNTGPGDGGASHGLFQWNGDRAAGFQAIYGHSPDSAPLDEQLDYVMHELNGPESLAKGRIAQAQGVDGKAAEVSQAYLRPKDVVPEMQRRSATALQLQRQNAQPGQGGQTTAAAPAAGGPVVVGDSLASSGGLGGSGVVGASPGAVRAQIMQGVQNGAYTGKDVVLSSGASNAPGDMENVEAQLKLLRDAGSVTLLGVGPAIEAKNPGTNANLQKLAAQYGAKFQPLPTDQMSPDGVHPNAAGYASLKTATAPPGPAPQGGRYQVASNAPVAPPGSTAPATATSAQPATAPAATALQPPAPAPPAAPQMVSPQGQLPAPPNAPALLSNGLTPQQSAIVQAQLRMPGANLQQITADVLQMQNQNRAAQQQAWADAHPDMHFQMTGDGIVVMNPKTGQPVGFVPATPTETPRAITDVHGNTYLLRPGQPPQLLSGNPSGVTGQGEDASALRTLNEVGPKIANGTASPQEQANYASAAEVYRKPSIKTDPSTGALARVYERDLPQGFPPSPFGSGQPGSGPTQLTPPVTRPPAATFDLQQSDYKEDQKELPQIAQAAQSARTAQVRWQTMLDTVNKISTGAGGQTRAELANIAETAGFPGVAQTLIAHTSDGDAAAAQEFSKLALASAGAAERGDLGSRGSLGAIKLYQQANPSLDLRPGANKAIIGMQLIAAQADADYNTAKLAYGNGQAQQLRSGGQYQPLTNFDQQWQQQRTPQVYAAAMGALNGQPVSTWAKGLSDDEYQRALQVVSRASPSAVVNAKSGRISMQPQGGYGTGEQSATAPVPGNQYSEGQTATGPNGQKLIYRGGHWGPL